MKRRLLSILLMMALLLCGTALCENLFENPDFVLSDGEPDGWSQSSYNPQNSGFAIDYDEHRDICLFIYSFDNNDARWTQKVKVSPNTEYKLTVEVRAENCGAWGRGANISVLDTDAYSDSVYDTAGEWQTLTLYGKTARKQDSITVALRLGGYSGDNTGKVWFRHPVIEECSFPADAISRSFATFEPADYSQASTEPSSLPERTTPTWLLTAFITALLFAAGITSVGRMNEEEERLCSRKNNARQSLSLAGVLLLAFAVRTFTTFKVRGYAVDINCFISWGESFYSNGLSFYSEASFCDYPPIYMILLGGISALRRLLGIAIGSEAHVYLIKLIPMLSDLASSLMVYNLFRRRASHKRALLLMCAVALSPALIADSAAWGQVDSLLALLLLLTVVFAVEGKWHTALPVFALAVLTKPQALMFGPVGLAFAAIDCVKNKKNIKKVLTGLIASGALIYIVCMPFAPKGVNTVDTVLVKPFTWIWGQLFGAANGYKYLTVNACNLYTLIDSNWAPLQNDFRGCFAWVMLAVSYVYAFVLCVLGKKREHLPLVGFTLMALVFAFAPMMHERYLFPALLLAPIAYCVCGDRRILYAFASLTVIEFLNIALVLEWGTIADFASYGHLQGSEQTINGIVSALTVLTALYSAYIAFDICALGHVKKIPLTGKDVSARAKKTLAESDYKLHLKRFDALAMAVVTIVYSFVAFTKLGVTESPQSYWKSTEYEETVTFDLGEVKTYRFTYFGGISGTRFKVALSNDGENWTEENYAEYAEGNMYTWMWYVPKTLGNDGRFTDAVYDEETCVDTGENGAQVNYSIYGDRQPLQTSRFLRIKVMGMGLILNEVAFIDTENSCLFPIVSVEGSNPEADYSPLTDEQSAVSLMPSYMNGMYFDEIYHARTAYEMLHGYSADRILEWSHPHLGKLLIALGIRIFGMTPFGWRFAGTLFGALMLPVLYLLIKQLTGNSRTAFIGMCLFALDSMHFTQTRLATVDTFVVFFILLMYLFMIRYFRMSMHREKLVRTFVPLGLSGICMGLACASKWTGIYAAAGLAVIFFISVGMRIKEYAAMRKSGDEAYDGIIRAFPRRLIITLLFCCVMFIIVPALIYYFSYYWHFATSGGLSLDKVWTLQQRMFAYHSQLVDDHAFKTPWYEWPTIVKPMWYYSCDKEIIGRGMVSSISCMGNPAVWWTGLAALIAGLITLACSRKTDKKLLLLTVGFAAQFLPWVLVPRSTFIYHYFASVPFIIMFTVVMLEKIRKRSRTAANALTTLLLCAALALFVMFYPLESGVPCDYRYALKLRWFKWYNFQLQ